MALITSPLTGQNSSQIKKGKSSAEKSIQHTHGKSISRISIFLNGSLKHQCSTLEVVKANFRG
jgi:hypothetical protein